MVCVLRVRACVCALCACGVCVVWRRRARLCVRARLVVVSACVLVCACAMYVVLCAAAGIRPLGLAQGWLSILAGWQLVYDRWD